MAASSTSTIEHAFREMSMDVAGRPNVSGWPFAPAALAQLVGAFGDRPEENESQVRFPLQGCLGLAKRIGPGEVPFNVEIVDVGVTGIGFLAPLEVYVGEGLELLLTFANCDIDGEWLCRVVRHHRQPEGWRVGARFLGKVGKVKQGSA